MYAKQSWRLLAGALLTIKASPAEVILETEALYRVLRGLGDKIREV